MTGWLSQNAHARAIPLRVDSLYTPLQSVLMKRRELERHLRQHGCSVLREGGNHTIYVNDANNRVTAVPRHTEIKTPTVREVCKALDIPAPDTR
jgi:predicted RNA binding protein YcfA (HicA-like mRNA interferase family)